MPTLSGLLLDDVRERIARDVLHDDVRPVVVFAHVEHRHDVGMMEPPGQPRLAREPLTRSCIVKPLPQELDRDQAIDDRIAGHVHRTHAAVGDQPLDAVATNGGGYLRHFGIGPREMFLCGAPL